MIGIDTNILVRAYLEDDPEQAKEAQLIISNAAKVGRLFISSYALLEFAWVLKVKKYDRQEIYEALMNLAHSAGVILGQRVVVLRALEKYISGKADFGDYMIMAEGEKNKSYQLKTFDKALSKELEL